MNFPSCKRLVSILLREKYRVIVLVRKGSESKVPAGAETVIANPFDANSFKMSIPPGCIFVQLLGVAHPSPKKAAAFRTIDLESLRASVDACAGRDISHFVYVSVAQSPSKIMAAYQAVRKEGETYCSQAGLKCTFIRPWYVLGPGHWWPILLYPFYAIAELVPSWRRQARSKALVTIKSMLHTLLVAIAQQPAPLRIYEICDIKAKEKLLPVRTGQQQASYL